ncbi:dihydrofolate reductase [Coemansia sp. RSA 1722]|nr:dihydrofolate reductase [Coemansia sp. RSA 485]KAJ2599982.1 dihydrofolate reductase [Coemansia sp. RSA 1722]
MSNKTLTLIVAAAAKNNGIGVNNDLPWRLRKDMAYFNAVTSTVSGSSDEKAPQDTVPTMNACILGRRCWESIPKRFRPLQGRYNIVLTSNPHLLDEEKPPFSVSMPSLKAALAHIDQLNASADRPVRIDRVFICGGYGVYKEAMMDMPNHIQILLTSVQYAEADRCDTFFPKIDFALFEHQPHERLEQVAAIDVPSGMQSEAGIGYEFMLYEKKKSS